MDFAVSTDVLAGKGTLSFNITDVFNSRIWRWDQNSEGFRSSGEFQWRARQFLLNFSYRLNQKKNKGGDRSRMEGGGDMDF
jgi:hypothetical protein